MINPPTLNMIAVTLLAELQGRMGYLPPVLRLQPNDTPPPPYQVAEIIDLRKVRERAREER
ncbi:MAG: CRISPR-associated protein Csx15 [Anaerolineae bacterium]